MYCAPQPVALKNRTSQCGYQSTADPEGKGRMLFSAVVVLLVVFAGWWKRAPHQNRRHLFDKQPETWLRLANLPPVCHWLCAYPLLFFMASIGIELQCLFSPLVLWKYSIFVRQLCLTAAPESLLYHPLCEFLSAPLKIQPNHVQASRVLLSFRMFELGSFLLFSNFCHLVDSLIKHTLCNCASQLGLQNVTMTFTQMAF